MKLIWLLVFSVNAFASNYIPDLSVTAGKLGPLSVTTAKLNTSSVTDSKIAITSPEPINCGITATVASHALTISITDAAGATPSATSPCWVSFRSTTAATGTATAVAAVAATSVVISNGSALGCTAAAACNLYVYAINNAGTIEAGVVGLGPLEDNVTQSSTAEGGSGTADSSGTLYSTTARSTKSVRLLGHLVITPAASFAWDNAVTTIQNHPIGQQTYAWSGYHDSTCSWALTSTTYTDFTGDGSCALVERTNTNFGVVSATGSTKPGIATSLPRNGRYFICVRVGVNGANVTPQGIRLWDGGTVIAEGEVANLSGSPIFPITLCGIYNGATSGATFMVQGKASAGATNITTGASTVAADWSIFFVGP